MTEEQMAYGKKLLKKLEREALGYEDSLSFAQGAIWAWSNAKQITASTARNLTRDFVSDDDPLEDGSRKYE